MFSASGCKNDNVISDNHDPKKFTQFCFTLYTIQYIVICGKYLATQWIFVHQPDLLFCGYPSGSHPTNSPVTHISNTLVI